MPRSPAQSDFTYESPTDVVEAEGASATSTRWVMWLTFLVLGALVLLCLIGPHVPSGE